MKRSRVTPPTIPVPAKKKKSHAPGMTSRDETPELEGRMPLPEEITGRASSTDDDLVALFKNKSAEHTADGFRGGSEDETPLAGT
jgi:hypothetical protein